MGAATLGAHLCNKRRELGLRRIDVAGVLAVDPKTLMWWERDERLPVVSAYPAILQFLRFEPWPGPCSLAEALLAERRRRGLEIRKAAALIGVDEGTWRHWERGAWRPTRLTLAAIDQFLGLSAAREFAADVR